MPKKEAAVPNRKPANKIASGFVTWKVRCFITTERITQAKKNAKMADWTPLTNSGLPETCIA